MDPSTSAPPPSTMSRQWRRFWWTVGFTLVFIGTIGSRLMNQSQLDPNQTSPATESDPEQPPKPARALMPHLLVCLLVFIALIALADACRARWSLEMGIEGSSTSIKVGVGSDAPSLAPARGLFQRRPPLSRRCSLVDLTVSLHERRESAALHHHHHHHQHQPMSLPESCDPPSSAMFPGTFRCGRRRPPSLARHSSLSIRDDAIPGSSSMAAVLRRSSSELSDGEASPDSRRRCSRLIRRH